MDDLISRQWLMECVNEGWIKFDTEKDENRFIHLVRDMAPSAQPELSDEESELIYRIGYEKGKLDGVKYCTERLKKMNDSFCGADMRGDSDEA